MNRIRFSCFAFLTAAAVACNKDDVITREEHKRAISAAVRAIRAVVAG